MSAADPSRLFSRRTLLKSGLFGVVAVVVGGAALTLQTSALGAKPAHPLRVFTAGEYAVFAAIAERLCPAAGAGAPGASALGVAEQADLLLERATEETQQ